MKTKQNPKKIKEGIVSKDETPKLEDSEKEQRKTDMDKVNSALYIAAAGVIIAVIILVFLFIIISPSYSIKDAPQESDASAGEDNSSAKEDAVESQEEN